MAAKAANGSRDPGVWAFWQAFVEESLQLRYAGDEIRKHLVAVNQRWWAQGTAAGKPEVHQTRVSRRYFGV